MLRHAEPISLPFVPATADDNQYGVEIYGTRATPFDVGSFFIPFKCEVMEAGLLIRTGLQGSGVDARIQMDRRFTPNSDTGRTSADVADINLGISGASAAGDVVYDLVGQDSSAGVTLEPGMEVVVEVANKCSGTGAAGRIWPYLLVRHVPEVRANLTKLQATT